MTTATLEKPARRHKTKWQPMALPHMPHYRHHVRPCAPDDMEMIVDSFAGFGGASTGIEAGDGYAVDVAINHNIEAVLLHELNHPNTRHLCQDIFEVEPRNATKGRKVGLFWASPDCTHFSRARGSRPKLKKIRGLANRILYWARQESPRVIMMENVKEFTEWGRLDKRTGQPDPRYKGELFHKFIRRLKQFGYALEYRILNAADYGAPTARHRLFIIARRDGQPITWPKKTHGPNRVKPYRTAAECIDWTLPCPSIFATSDEILQQYGIRAKRPLAEHTMRRIAKGIVKYVLEAAKPFIVRTGHYSNITGEGDTFRGQGLNNPLGVVCSVNDKALVIPSITAIDNKSSDSGHFAADEPLRTIVQENRFALTTAFLAKHYGGVVGQDVQKPIGTITAVDHHSLVSAFLAKFRGDLAGSNLREPMPTITAGGKSERPAGCPHAMGLVAANMVSLKHGQAPAYGCDSPLRTICAQGNHAALVASFLVKYYGQGCGQNLTDPLGTITGRDTFGLVTVNIDGQLYAIVDIGLRMLKPHELLKAQFGFHADGYVINGSTSRQVSGIGNSVCPDVAAALVRANFKRQFVK